MSKVDEAIIEIEQALATLAPEEEGLDDFDSLDITPETEAIVKAAKLDYAQRRQLLTTAWTALNALQVDGHPVLNIDPVSLSVKADLDAQMATLNAALAKFTTTAATTLGMSASAPEPK